MSIYPALVPMCQPTLGRKVEGLSVLPPSSRGRHNSVLVEKWGLPALYRPAWVRFGHIFSLRAYCFLW